VAYFDLPDIGTVDFREPKRTDFPPNLSGAVAFTFAKVLYHVIAFWGVALHKFLAAVLNRFFEIILPDFQNYLNPFLDELLRTPNLPPAYRKLISDLKATPAPPVVVAAGMVLLGVATGQLGRFTEIFLSGFIYSLQRQYEPARPDPASAISMWYRAPVNQALIAGWLDDLGWSSKAVDMFKEIYRPRVSPWEWFAWAWRSDATPENAREELTRRGYHPDDISKMIKLAEMIPSATDLIRMAVREAWADDIAKKYGYDLERPGLFVSWMKRQGFSEDWAFKYWRAHWELPSVSQAVSMIHRGVISTSEFDDLLRIQDYPTWWRPKMRELIKTAIPRVDIRRMLNYGLIGPEKLPSLYGLLGYDPEAAALMSQLAIKMGTEDESTYTKGEILTGYRTKAISRGEAMTMLTEAGYSVEYADFLLDLEDQKALKADIEDKITLVQAKYERGLVNDTQAHSELDALGLEPARTDFYLNKWRVTVQAKTRRLSESEIETLYKANIISLATARTNLDYYGYTDAHIDWIVKLWTQEQAKAAEEEAARANAEADRIAKQKKVTDYQKNRATIEVAIAELRLRIANLKLALFEAVTDEERFAIGEEIAAVNVLIAGKQVDLSKLKLAL